MILATKIGPGKKFPEWDSVLTYPIKSFDRKIMTAVYAESKFTFPDPAEGNLYTLDLNCPPPDIGATYGLGN